MKACAMEQGRKEDDGEDQGSNRTLVMLLCYLSCLPLVILDGLRMAHDTLLLCCSSLLLSLFDTLENSTR